MGDNIIKYNPFGAWRVGQEEVVRSIIDAYDKGIHVVELSAPTGSGKTLAMVASGNAILDRGEKRVIYTTPLVALVDQLGRSREYNIPTLVGKRNYPCLLRTDMTAEDCPFKPNDVGDPDICPACPYRHAKFEFLTARYGATTMARFLFDPGVRKTADVVMIDESATVEDALLRACSLKLPEKLDTTHDFQESVMAWSAEMESEIATLNGEYTRAWLDAKKKVSKSQVRDMLNTSKIIRSLERNIKKCDKILYIINSRQDYFIDKDHTFKVVHGGKLFAEMASGFKLIVLASGTPTTPLICSAFKKICAPHPIDVSRRRVYACPVGKMSAKTREITAPIMAKKIGKLHDKYGKNTIVHCGNYKSSALLTDSLKDLGYKTISQTSETREDDFRQWRNATDAIFTSVAYTNGIDLEGTNFPMNIIANLPYPNLGDEWVQRRGEYDNKRWYNTSVAVDIQQAAGRCTRTPTDHSETWILDTNFMYFYKHNSSLFEPWFKEAMMFVR